MKNFEKKFNRLEEVVGVIENENISLHDFVELYKEAISLHCECNSIIKDAKIIIEQIENNSY